MRRGRHFTASVTRRLTRGLNGGLEMPDTDIMIGKIVQYRKVGTFRVVARINPYWWYWCVPVKAPKRYRDRATANGGRIDLCVQPKNIVGACCVTCDGEGKLYCDACGGHFHDDPLCVDPLCEMVHFCPDECDGVSPVCPDCKGSGSIAVDR